MEEEKESSITAKIECGEFRVSLTADAWLSRICKEFTVVVGNYVDSEWSKKCVTLAFSRFNTPHIGRAAEAFWKEVIEH